MPFDVCICFYAWVRVCVSLVFSLHIDLCAMCVRVRVCLRSLLPILWRKKRIEKNPNPIDRQIEIDLNTRFGLNKFLLFTIRLEEVWSSGAIFSSMSRMHVSLVFCIHINYLHNRFFPSLSHSLSISIAICIANDALFAHGFMEFRLDRYWSEYVNYVMIYPHHDRHNHTNHATISFGIANDRATPFKYTF